MIVDKPAGLLTVPTEAREKDTLWSRVLFYLQHRYGGRPYGGIVHRLDKDTSGAVVFARNRAALHFLQARFREHAIEREYVALVAGNPPDQGVYDADLVRTAGLRRSVARPGEEGRRAVTHYRTLERLPGASLVAATARDGPHASDPAFTSRPRAIRSSGTGSTGPATPNAKRRARCSTRGRSASPTPSRAGASRRSLPCRRISRRRSPRSASEKQSGPARHRAGPPGNRSFGRRR